MKRGSSEYSLVVGVDKPCGMSSHDVVNRCRAIFGERRVGHAGTLDPAASGVLPVLIGPATRLDAYLTGHDKRYRASIAFGAATDTDDAAGRVTRTAPVPPRLRDERFAADCVAGLVGARKQLPPTYSAVKVDGKRSYEQARRGTIIDLAPRDVEVYAAELLAVREGGEGGEGGCAVWDVDLRVSKGTYIRAIARDLGLELGCPAHLAGLRRTAVGDLGLEDCVSLEVLGELKDGVALDPVVLLGCRFAFVFGETAARVRNGAALPAADVALFERRRVGAALELCSCTAGVFSSEEPPADGELIAVLADNRLCALYGYEGQRAAYTARCVFQTGVSRGKDL